MSNRRRPRTAEKEEEEETQPTGETYRVIDPTHVLLARVSRVESRVPWLPIGIILLVVLWIPALPRLAADPVRPAEQNWIQEALASTPSVGSSFSHALVRSVWSWQDVDIEGATLAPEQRRALRAPFALAFLVGTIVFYFLARLMIGHAGALIAAMLLSICVPWIRAGTSALPLIVGESMVLLGVAWAMTLQGRHREVGVARVTAGRVGFAGIFLGLGILLTPAAFATFVATVLVWLFVGLRRSSPEATTLPVESPARTVALAVAGTVVFLVGSAAAVWAAEKFSGGAGIPVLYSNGGALARGVDLWTDLYRRLLSPGPSTDLLLAVTFLIILVVRALEWFGGRPWQTAGLLPWVFLVLWVVGIRRDNPSLDALDVPITVPPLFMLGFAWVVLRGLHPGRFRRQEYTFLLVWLAVALVMVPVVPGMHRHSPVLAAAVTLLPVLLLLAGRATRSLWEAEPNALARIGILIFVSAPVALFLAVPVAGLAGDGPRDAVTQAAQQWLPLVLISAAGLGIVAELFIVRPDVPLRVPGPRPRRSGVRRGGRRRSGRPDKRRRRPKS